MTARYAGRENERSNTRSSGAPATPAARESSSSSSILRRGLTILLLALAGGGVDAVIMLGFGVLTAAQTGNTILLAVAVAQGHFARGGHSAVSAAGYILGTVAGEWIIVARRASASRLSPVGLALTVELVSLGGLLALWLLGRPERSWGGGAVLIALTALAMGIQSAAALRVHAGPATTYITGTLTTFTTEVVRRLRRGKTAVPQPSTDPEPGAASFWSSHRPWIYGMTWLVYAGGALAGALLFHRARAAALVLPIVMILAAIAVSGGRRPPVAPPALR